MDEDKAMVIFQPSGRRGEVPKGITLIEASRLLGVDIEALCGEKNVSIDQIGCLIVGDNRDAFSLRLKAIGKPGYDGGLTRTQKAADHDKTRIVTHCKLSFSFL